MEKENKTDALNEIMDICMNCGKQFIIKNGKEKYCSVLCRTEYHNCVKEFDNLGRIPDFLELKIAGNSLREKIRELKMSIDILKSLRIGRQGLRVHIDDLLIRNFDPRACSYRFSTEKSNEAFILEYGPYVMTWESKDYVFIRIKTL